MCRLEQQERILRLKRGLYVVSPEESGKPLSKELIANHLYAPSYLSMQTALRYYGIIPEAVYTMQSMTIKPARTFDTPIGRFNYIHTSRETFPVGITTLQGDGIASSIATPEKALCDLIASSPQVNLRYHSDVAHYLHDDMRMDMEAVHSMNTDILETYAAVGKKANSIRTLIKYLRS